MSWLFFKYMKYQQNFYSKKRPSDHQEPRLVKGPSQGEAVRKLIYKRKENKFKPKKKLDGNSQLRGEAGMSEAAIKIDEDKTSTSDKLRWAKHKPTPEEINLTTYKVDRIVLS